MSKRLSFYFTLLVIFYSCQKGTTDNSPAPTKTELLTSASWKFKMATVGGSDVSGFLQSCQKDNILIFQSTGNGTLDEGATKCNASDPQSNPFTWNFSGNETVLHISAVLFSGGSSDFSIVSLNSAQLVVAQDITVSGTTQNAVVTFIH
jgi:hypothetical protein